MVSQTPNRLTTSHSILLTVSSFVWSPHFYYVQVLFTLLAYNLHLAVFSDELSKSWVYIGLRRNATLGGSKSLCTNKVNTSQLRRSYTYLRTAGPNYRTMATSAELQGVTQAELNSHQRTTSLQQGQHDQSHANRRTYYQSAAAIERN